MFFLHNLHRCLVSELLNLAFIVEPLAELFKRFLKGLFGVISAVCNPLIKESREQSLNLAILPRAPLVNLVVKDSLCL